MTAVQRPAQDLERQLGAAARRYKTQVRALRHERDELIRAAITAGFTRARITALTGLSAQRIDQIRRSARR